MKMTKKSIYVFITASLAAISAPGRFAVGFIMLLEMNILMLCGTLFRHAVSKFRIGQLANPLILVFLIFITILYKQILVFISPETVIQIGFIAFIPPVSSYFINSLFGTKAQNVVQDLNANMSQTLTYSLFTLLFFLLRDIIGYGTFTYVTFSGVKEIVIFDRARTSAMSFFATIPGALFSVALILAFYIFVMNKIKIISRADKNGEGA